MSRGLLVLCVLALSASSLFAIDYDSIERTILREPSYQSGSPKYVLLLFGPMLKRVWVVIDGDMAYVDRNSDGDLTAANEQFKGNGQHWETLNIEIPDPDNKTTYEITNMQVIEEKASPTGRYLFMNVKINGPVKFKEYCNSNLWDSPAKATLTHFNGPLVIVPDTVGQKLARGGTLTLGKKSTDLMAMVGTFDPRCGCWVVVRSMNGETREFRGYAPMADIEFPSNTPGDRPVRQQYLLDGYCCGCIFKGDVKAPPEAGPGIAKVTFSFNMWKEGKVVSSTVDMPIIAAKQAKEEQETSSAEK